MRLAEMHIEVEDLEKSLALYKQLIPHKECLRWGNGKVAALVLENGTAFGLWEKGHKGIHEGSGGAHCHFAFEITPEEYETYKQKIADAGLEVLEHIWENGEKSLYFYDYDGHQGEFITTDWIKLNNL